MLHVRILAITGARERLTRTHLRAASVYDSFERELKNQRDIRKNTNIRYGKKKKKKRTLARVASRYLLSLHDTIKSRRVVNKVYIRMFVFNTHDDNGEHQEITSPPPSKYKIRSFVRNSCSRSNKSRYFFS